jgi:hypothetical protein
MTLSLDPRARRSIAIAALAGASLALGVVGASAQGSTATGPATTEPPAAEAVTSSKPQTVEQRIAMLKSALKITPELEPKWDKVAAAMRENAASMDRLVREKQAKAQSITAVDDLKTYRDFTQAHLDGLKKLTSAFESLYDSMSADQKKNADQVFHNFAPSKTRPQG